MPAGDPAGYLPNVIKDRLRKKGQKPYKARKRGSYGSKLVPLVPPIKTGVGPQPGKLTPLPSRKGDTVQPKARRRRFNPRSRRTGF